MNVWLSRAGYGLLYLTNVATIMTSLFGLLHYLYRTRGEDALPLTRGWADTVATLFTLVAAYGLSRAFLKIRRLTIRIPVLFVLTFILLIVGATFWMEASKY